MSRSENGSVSPTSGNTSTSHHQRLCHIVKRDDFDGYGFNLHSEKGKPGQYIGKVDEHSPAEQAGLHQGDRIIEVNGVNIGSETHKQVVQRIKAIANEVRLLVIDPSLEKKNINNNGKTANDSSTTTSVTSTITVQSSTVHAEATTKNDETNSIIPGSATSPTTSIKSESNSASCSGGININNNSISKTPLDSKTDSNNKTSEVDTSNIPQQQQQQQLSSSIPSHQNGTTSTGTGSMMTTTTNANANSSPQKSTGLNLPMTAAEMRAKLLARKKYDPKNDSVDLRKKFEIIQKL